MVAAGTLATVASPARAEGGVGVPVISFGSCGLSTSNPYIDGGGFGSSAVAVQTDGKLVVAGVGNNSVGVFRLLPGGSLDVGFGHNGGTLTPLQEPGTGTSNIATVSDVLVQPDGRIVVAGANNRPSGGTHFQFVRHLADGRLDTSFGTAGQVVLAGLGPLATIALQPDGKLVGAGGGTVVRLDQSGVLDPTFASDGAVDPAINGNVQDMAVLPDGRILLGFQPYGDGGFGVARLLPDGTLDASFGPGGIAVVAPPQPPKDFGGFAIDSLGRIVSAGTTTSRDGHIALTRHLSDGALDLTFGTGGVAKPRFPVPEGSESVATSAVDVIVQPDGKPVVATLIRSVGGPNIDRTDAGLVRLTAAGALDPGFGTGGFTVTRYDDRDAVPQDVAATADGGVVIAAYRDNREGATALIRYRGDTASSVDDSTVTPQNCAHTATIAPEAAPGYGTHVVHTLARGPDLHLHQHRTPTRSGEQGGLPRGRRSVCRAVHQLRRRPPGPWGVVRRLGGVRAHRRRLVLAHAPGVGRHRPVMAAGDGPRRRPGHPRRLGLERPGPARLGAGAQSLVAGGPSGLGQVASLSAGYHHTLAATDSGAVYAWGWNHYGQGGSGCLFTADGCLGSFEPRPVHVPTSFRPADAVAAGGFHNLVLLRDGGVLSWGMNSSGQLGLGHRNAQVVSFDVPGLADVVAVSAGIYHSLALKSDGTVWAWGWNHFGQLGDGTTTDRLVPTRVPGLTGVTAISGGGYHSLALKGDGSVVGWGFNNVGQVGDGTTLNRLSPVAVPGAAAVTRLAAGGFHSLAVTADGAVTTWGWNAFGQLGDGTTVDRASPAVVTTGIAIAGGLGHSVALQTDGTVKSWGWNALGQLGDGTTTTRTAPVTVSGMLAATIVTAGALHSVAE